MLEEKVSGWIRKVVETDIAGNEAAEALKAFLEEATGRKIFAHTVDYSNGIESIRIEIEDDKERGKISAHQLLQKWIELLTAEAEQELGEAENHPRIHAHEVLLTTEEFLGLASAMYPIFLRYKGGEKAFLEALEQSIRLM
ncbi:MAG: hypothetical protein N2557_08455 [Hydrogenophilus sp.]|nr:hypothetical protein [Hydrogenophilus sp.]